MTETITIAKEELARLEERIRKCEEQRQKELAEHERAQEALLRYSEEIQDLYDRAPCGYHSLDPNGVYLRINDTELKWLGYQREEVIGKMRFSDLITERSLKTFEDNFPRFLAQGWIKDLEFEMVRKDGSILPVLLSATSVFHDGEFAMSRSTIYDITEQKKAQEKEHLLSAIIQSSDVAVIAKDLDGVILSWNTGAERIYGYSAEEAIGKTVGMLLPDGNPEELEQLMTRIRRNERIEHYTAQRMRKDGQVISVAMTVSPILDGSGTKLVGASTIALDITDKLRAEEEIVRLNKELEVRVTDRTNDLEAKQTELVQSQKALMNIVEDLNQKTAELEDANARLQELERLKSMFIASMSHELRTPLNSIIGFSSIILNEWLGPVNPEQKENLATILRSGKHLLSLINDVIDVSKIEAGKIECHIEECDLYDLLSEAVQYLEKDIRAKGLRLNLRLQRQTIRTERRRLLQCVINLLSNALKFTESGEITVETSSDIDTTQGPSRLEGTPVCIAVHDTGIGIAAQDIPRLFQPFIRLESSIKTTVPGTGLGLYLTRKLVEEVLRGNILCTSAVGVGSSFTIRIPERIDEKGTGSRG